ncbi:OmpP1/FadL family transporter [Zhouia amylolytica]|uniref:Transporter n=1 Tax=Zhouia amylolytica AD3 TaxID=1286632 RepID=W2ULA6_9FLAO|nr:outer membrane protein transport protein [Zhouia amylolytica]ETN94960.1 hypothetical protein P278_21180 [Zhouia amylolytica AD3]
MKKITTLFAVCATAWMGSAQNINDVVDYGTTTLNGSARYQSMSGAFGALGGDLSSLNINPAGSAVFNHGAVTFSGTSYNNKIRSGYFNTFNESTENDFRLNQIGGVMVFNSTQANSNWNKLALAFNYEYLNNGDTEFFSNGLSNQSIDQYFLNNANGFYLDEISALPGESVSDAYYEIGSDPNLGYPALQGLLGYEGYIVNSVDENDPNNTSYFSNANYTNVNQEYYSSRRSADSKFTANMATMFNDNIYLGANLNFYNIDRERYNWLYEDGYNTNSNLQSVYFENLLRTFGNAFSFNVGAIAKLNDMVRVGLSYQSPTWYNLTDELQQYVETDVYIDNNLEYITVDPRVIFVFPDYDVQLPSKYTGSLAMVFGKHGLLSLDYSYQDMSRAKLKPTQDPYFANENTRISNNLKGVSSFRLGGEYRISRLSLRAGYQFEESPYKSGNTVGDLTGYSLGLGYNFGAVSFDAGFSQLQREYDYQLYDTGLTNTTRLDKESTNVTLSATIKL